MKQKKNEVMIGSVFQENMHPLETVCFAPAKMS